MPIEIWNGSAYVPLSPSGIERAEYWDGSQYRSLWESFTPAYYRDDFNTDRDDGWGPMWTSQSSPAGRVSGGVAVNKVIGSGQSSQWVVGRLNGLPNTDDVVATVKLVKSTVHGQANDMEFVLALRATTTWQSGRAVWFAVYPGSCSINTADGATATARATGGAIPVGSELEFIAVDRYYAIRNVANGNVIVDWIDDSEIVPRAESNRSLWMFQKGNFPVFQSAFSSYAADYVEYQDMQIPAPIYSSRSPETIPSYGGILTIYGTYFLSKPVVKMDGITLPSVELVTRNEIRVQIPATSPGNHTLEYIFPGGKIILTLPVYESTQAPQSMTRPATPTFNAPTRNTSTVTGFSAASGTPANAVANGSELVALTPGNFRVNWKTSSTGSTSGTISLMKNGVALQTVNLANSIDQTVQSVSLAVGDKLRIEINNTSWSATTNVGVASVSISPV